MSAARAVESGDRASAYVFYDGFNIRGFDNNQSTYRNGIRQPFITNLETAQSRSRRSAERSGRHLVWPHRTGRDGEFGYQAPVEHAVLLDAATIWLVWYVRWDASIGYEFRYNGFRITPQLNVYNLLDKVYYDNASFRGNIRPGTSVTYEHP